MKHKVGGAKYGRNPNMSEFELTYRQGQAKQLTQQVWALWQCIYGDMSASRD